MVCIRVVGAKPASAGNHNNTLTAPDKNASAAGVGKFPTRRLTRTYSIEDEPEANHGKFFAEKLYHCEQ